MMDSLLDWITPTKGLRRLNAQRRLTSIGPPHTPLTSVDELKKIFGWLNTLRIPDGTKISPRSLVVVSRSTQRTPRATCYAPLIPDDFVDRFLQARRGPDALDGTTDDPQMDQQTAFALLGFGGVQSGITAA